VRGSLESMNRSTLTTRSKFAITILLILLIQNFSQSLYYCQFMHYYILFELLYTVCTILSCIYSPIYTLHSAVLFFLVMVMFDPGMSLFIRVEWWNVAVELSGEKQWYFLLSLATIPAWHFKLCSGVYTIWGLYYKACPGLMLSCCVLWLLILSPSLIFSQRRPVIKMLITSTRKLTSSVTAGCRKLTTALSICFTTYVQHQSNVVPQLTN